MGIIQEFSKKTTCPHCKESFSVAVSLDVTASVVLGSEGFMPDEIRQRRGESLPQVADTTKAGNYLSSLDESQRLTIEMAEKAGMLDAFSKAFEHAHGVLPANIPKAFMGWLRTAKSKLIAADVLEFFKDEFRGQINFVASQSVGAVTADGEVVQFLPCQIIGQAPPGAVRIAQTSKQLVANVKQWTRTKYGYVAGNGAFLDSMRKKSYGDFCKPIL